MQRRGCGEFIYLAGDSSLDNKYWLKGWQPACNGYEDVLSPPQMKQDICYWLNYHLERLGGSSACCINTAVEATTLGSRSGSCGALYAQDRFIQEHITENDTLIVSVGGNDIALMPTPCTIAAMANLVCCTTTGCIRRGVGLGLPYFRWMFKSRVQAYIEQLISLRKPKQVLVCMIYFPDEAAVDSWAGLALCCLGYNTYPQKLQTAISKVYETATARIDLRATQTLPVPLHMTLDGKTSSDYVARVEPSISGGEKMALAFLERMGKRGGGALDPTALDPTSVSISTHRL